MVRVSWSRLARKNVARLAGQVNCLATAAELTCCRDSMAAKSDSVL